MLSIHTENWTYCRYKNQDFKAFISFGATPEGMERDELEYYVTVLQGSEGEEREIFQKSFTSLGAACQYLNLSYGDWELDDQTASKSGCSSCAAH